MYHFPPSKRDVRQFNTVSVVSHEMCPIGYSTVLRCPQYVVLRNYVTQGSLEAIAFANKGACCTYT